MSFFSPKTRRVSVETADHINKEYKLSSICSAGLNVR